MSGEENKLKKDLDPKEKILQFGVERLSEAELIAVILVNGTKNHTALEIGYEVLNLCKAGLPVLFELEAEELMEIPGIGKSKACQILASIELYKRAMYYKNIDKIQIKSPYSVVKLVYEDMSTLCKEHFKVVLLDVQNQIKAIETVSVGTINQAVVSPIDVFGAALRRSCKSIILLHNHPSGVPNPSDEDIRLTKRLMKCAFELDMRILDHIIIGSNYNYYSFLENGRIKFK